MFKKILACLDGSSFAEQILPYAAEHAIRYRSHLGLLYVIGPGDLPAAAGIGVEDLMEKQIQAEAKAKIYLEQLARKYFQEDRLWVESITENGQVGEAIIKYARDHKVDLIAIATHGESGAQRMVFGSVADFVMRNSDVPLLVIRPVTEKR